MYEGPKSTMHARTDNVDFNVKNNIPGPGTYALQDRSNPNFKNPAAFSMGSGSRTDFGGGKEGMSKPGPGKYDSKADATQKAAPKFGFGSM